MDGRGPGTGIATGTDVADTGSESRALTGLRGLAALLVMLHHFKLRLGVGDGVPGVQLALQHGYLGVDLFFVLSGFVLAMTYGSWFDGSRQGGLGDYGRFLIRRVARLWPLHAAMLAVFVALGTRVPDAPFSTNTVLANLALVQAWGVSRAINPPAWSVSTEMFAYTVFPLLAMLALRGRVRPALCCGGVAAALLLLTHLGPPIGPGRRGLLDVYLNYSFLPVMRCLAGFTTGMLAWRANTLPAVRRLAAAPWLAPAAATAVIAIVLARADDLWAFPFLPVVVLSLHVTRGAAYRALAHGPVHRLGVLSYALYLTHLLLLDSVPFGTWPLALELSVFLLATLAVAVAAHALVEVPGRRLVRAAGEGLLSRVAPRLAPRPLHQPPR